MEEKILFRHYGDNELSEEKFAPIKNISFMNKPSGGLWGSPETNLNWINWYEAEGSSMLPESYWEKYFDFVFKDESKLLIIDSYEKFYDVYSKYKYEKDDFLSVRHEQKLDYEKIAEEYDGLYVELSSSYQQRNGHRLREEMAVWDVDSVVVFNPKAIEIVEKEHQREREFVR